MQLNPFPGTKAFDAALRALPTEVSAPNAARRVVRRAERIEP